MLLSQSKCLFSFQYQGGEMDKEMVFRTQCRYVLYTTQPRDEDCTVNHILIVISIDAGEPMDT